SGRLLVETMHDALPPLLTPRRKRPAAPFERVDQRSRPVPGRRMHHHPRGFVDDYDIVVLERDGDGDVLGEYLPARGRWDRDDDLLAGGGAVRSALSPTRDEHTSVGDQRGRVVSG